jgi:hypothetical protein
MRWRLGSLMAGRLRPVSEAITPPARLPDEAPARAPVADWRRLPALRPAIAPMPVLTGGTDSAGGG